MGRYEIIIHKNWRNLWTIEDVALAANTHPQVIEYFVEYGLLEPEERMGPKLFFSAEAVSKVKMIQRLRSDVGVNLPGIAIILDLTDKVRQLQNEVEWYRLRSGL